MPNLPLVDAHLHLWDPRRFRMPWLDGNALLDRPYLLDDYNRHTEGIEVAAMVYLQVEVSPAYALLEARWVSELAMADPRIQGIVPWAPLEDGDRAASFLEALATIDPRIRGVRRLLQSEPLDFGLQPDFVRGVRLLPRYELSFDLGISHLHLANAISLVRACPETSFVLDHIGKPDIATGRLDPWRAEIELLAALPNVCCKVSGMVTEAERGTWQPEDLAPYLAHVLGAFGEDRVLFGGDWPVCLMGSPYLRWVETLDALTTHLSEDAKRKLWAENARRFYRLPPA